MTKIAYTHSFKPDSTAIAKVYYAQDEQMLFVEPLRGDGLAGYYDVPFADFIEFINAPSAGRHWRVIKDTFQGFNTGGIELVEAVDGPEVQDVTQSEQKYAATILPVNPPAPTFAQHRYEVEVEVTRKIKRTVMADSLDEALVEVQRDLEPERVKVVSATQFFD